MYLLTCRNPAVGTLPRYRNAPMKTRGPDRWVASDIIPNNDLFVLKFWIHSIYVYTSLYPHLQAALRCISCPVESESRERWPRLSGRGSHDHYHILEFRAL